MPRKSEFLGCIVMCNYSMYHWALGLKDKRICNQDIKGESYLRIFSIECFNSEEISRGNLDFCLFKDIRFMKVLFFIRAIHEGTW